MQILILVLLSNTLSILDTFIIFVRLFYFIVCVFSVLRHLETLTYDNTIPLELKKVADT